MLKYYKYFALTISIFFSLILCSGSIPIIFIHTNDAAYLGDTLWQAKQYNERVILLGDDKNRYHATDGIEYYPISNFNNTGSYFASIYKHMSGVPYEFELACFVRWFVLEEFMRLNNIPVAFYCDSDVMLYCDITKEHMMNFKQYNMSVMQVGYSGGLVSYWDKASIAKFTNFLKRFYEDPKINWFVNEFNHNRIWIHDDTPMLTDFVANNRSVIKIGNTGQMINNAVFDPCIWYDVHIEPIWPGPQWIHKKYQTKSVFVPDYATMNLKDVVWQNNLPYCYNTDLRILVRLKSIHFQGAPKKIIKDYRKSRLH